MNLERTSDGKYTPVFAIKDVLDTGTLKLHNGIIIKLVGITGNREKEAMSFVKSLVSKTKIALVSEPDIKIKNTFYVYLIDLRNEKLPFRINHSSPEVKGFTDLKINFFNVSKGATYNLNLILLRSGWAKLDESNYFEYLPYFKSCEEEARRNGRGLWKR